MECDWEVEVGGDAPVIDAAWEGFVDLRRDPWRVNELAEVAQLAALAGTLRDLNGDSSPVWTSKCDFLPSLGSEDFDPDEMDAGQASAICAAACYLDLLPREGETWDLDQIIETLCKPWCAGLRAVDLRGCRVDLVVRRAVIAAVQDVVPEATGKDGTLGITAYVTACGASETEAKAALGPALAALAHAICIGSTLQ